MTQQTVTAQTEPLLGDLVEHLVQFDGPPEQFMLHLLAVQCHVGSAEGGAILRAGAKKEPEVIAVFPPAQDGQTVPGWLSQAVQVVPQALSSAETVTSPVQMPDQLYGQEPLAYVLMIPLRGTQNVRGAAAFFIQSRDSDFIDQCRQRLELTVSLLSLYEMRLTHQARRSDLKRMRRGLEVLAAINEADRFKGCAMAFCNELATAFTAERVSVGFLKGRYVRVEGMSHTEKVVRKMEVVQAVESSMEECLDQDVEVLHPTPAEATFVSRAANLLATKHGPTTVCSLPLRRAGKVQGVLTIERATDQPFELEDVETARLIADLCTARLLELREHDKWIGAKAAGATCKGLAALVGPRHTWAKVAAIGICAAIAFLTLYPADWRVDAPFDVQTVEHQVIAAPFTGRIGGVNVEVGDEVVANQTVLLTLDTSELRAALARATAQKDAADKTSGLAMREGETARSQIARHEAEQAQAQITLLEDQINKAEIRSRISGRVLEGDLKGRQGATVERGDVLMRVAPVDALRAELLVPEKRIGDVLAAVEASRQQRQEAGIQDDDRSRRDGELAAVAFPGQYLPFIVERVSPVAEVVDQRNIFRVRVRFQLHQLDEKPEGLSPGLQGVAKVHIGTASYAWLWTRDLVDWVRMKLWL